MVIITDVYVELDGWEEFTSKLKNLANGGLVNDGFKRYTEHVREIVIEGTHEGVEGEDLHRGQMKKSWQQPQYQSTSENYKATITNTAEYGYESNYGHYQTPGMYVPAIGARLIHEYVPGTYALEGSLQKAEINFESVIKPEILAKWYDYKESKDQFGNEYYTVRQSYYDKPGEELIDS